MPSTVALVDSHCHIDFPELSPRLPEITQRMAAQHVSHALCVSVNLEDFPRVLAVAERYPNVFASVGVHPDHEGGEEPSAERLETLADHPRIVAIGETGLDYYRHPEAAPTQQARFRAHIRAARACAKPLIIHTRDAGADTLAILQEENAASVGGVMHCFTESMSFARSALALNFYISFSGIVTFKNAADLREVAAAMPLDRILVETDSPYLAPVPHRGKINEPSYVRHVAEALARVRGIPVETLAAATSENFFRLFSGAKQLAP